MKIRKLTALVCVFVLLAQMLCLCAYAGEAYVSFNSLQLFEKYKLSVKYGSSILEEDGGESIITCTPGYGGSMTAIINFSDDNIDISSYRYMAITFFRTGDCPDIILRIFSKDSESGKTSDRNIMEYGLCNEWYRLVVDIGKYHSGKVLEQIHFYPYPEEIAEDLPEEYVCFKSVEFYGSDPRTEAEKARDAQIKENAENIKGEIQEYGRFEELEGLEKTGELLGNTDCESIDGWNAANCSAELSDGAYEGSGCIKVYDMLYSYSGINQDVTSVLRKNGAGYYKISAYLKSDGDFSQSTGFADVRINIVNPQYDENGVRIPNKVENKTVYSTYYIDNKWIKNENVVYVPWRSDSIKATFAVYGRSGKYGDFYVDNCSMTGYISNDREETHASYIAPGGKFFPDEKITSDDFAEMLKNCGCKNDYAKLQGGGFVTGADLADILNDAFGYSTAENYIGKETVTRAEAVYLINRASGRFPRSSSFNGIEASGFSDVSEEHWAYNDIIEATNSHEAYIHCEKDGISSEVWKVGEENYNRKNAGERISEINAQSCLRKLEILNSADMAKISGTKYYFSNNGSDDNTGLSPKQAFKSLSKLAEIDFKEGDAALFERGSIWRGANISCVSGVTYGAYGKGEKPIFYGSEKNYAQASMWQETEKKNVWQTTDKIYGSAGFVSFNGGKIIAKKVSSEEELCGNFTFYDGTSSNSSIKLYYDGGNPGEIFENIEIAPGRSIFLCINRNNCTFDNLCLMYTGGHGMRFSNVSNIRVTNCSIGYVGGMGESVRWGNGIEFWKNADNILVDNNYIFQIYDTAITNQFSGVSSAPVIQQNIVYSNNVIEYSTYAFEFFSSQQNSNLDIMKNITVKNNIMRFSGYGWGEENRPDKEKSAHIIGWRSKSRSENFKIENNVFQNARFRNIYWSCFAYNLKSNTVIMNNKTPQYLPKLNNNIFIDGLNDKFGEFDYTSYSFDYDINKNLSKDGIDKNAEILFCGMEDDSGSCIVGKPSISVQAANITAGSKITAALELSDNNREDMKINFVLCLYGGIKETAIDVNEYIHKKGANSTILVNEITVPKGNYRNYEIRAYVFDDNLKKYTDTVSIKRN